jgi:hypothetical protein
MELHHPQDQTSLSVHIFQGSCLNGKRQGFIKLLAHFDGYGISFHSIGISYCDGFETSPEEN